MATKNIQLVSTLMNNILTINNTLLDTNPAISITTIFSNIIRLLIINTNLTINTTSIVDTNSIVNTTILSI